MSRLQMVERETATGKAKTLLDGVQAKLGKTPNIMRVMANSPAVLEGYLNFSGALAGGTLSAGLREQIALAVSQANSCDYCLAAHATIGKMVGLTPAQISGSRAGQTGEAKADAAIRFARMMVERRGQMNDNDLTVLRGAGHGDGEITEIVANVALNMFTNYFNHVVDTTVDFPAAPALA